MTFPAGFGEIVEELRRSTVVISSRRGGGGSGIIVEREGLVVTNAHVVSTEIVRVQTWDGRISEGSVVARGGGVDLALVSVPMGDLLPARLLNSQSTRNGEFVVAVGNPFGFIGAVTTGVIRGVGAVRGLGDAQYLQCSLRLAPGNSGGPLANAKGEVIGVNSMVVGGVGLAIPTEAVQRFLTRAQGEASLGVIGRKVPLTINGSPQVGLVLLEIRRGSSADRAALLPGDIIIGANERPFGSMAEIDELFSAPSGQLLRIQFVRGDRSHRRSVALVMQSSRNRAA
jgi:serine protease Do